MKIPTHGAVKAASLASPPINHLSLKLMLGIYRCVTLPFHFLGGLQPCAAYFSGGVVNSGCSDEAALSLTGEEKTREETGVRGAKAETPSIYRQRQTRGKKRGENRTDMGTRGEKKGEVQKQQELIKEEQPVVLSCDACANGGCKTPFWCLQQQKAAFACVKSSLQTLPGWSAALYVCSGSPGIQGISQPRSLALLCYLGNIFSAWK